jgi:hypothetical protein
MATIKKYKFSEADANIILAMGQQGASQKAMYAAIGISRATAMRLKKDDPFFAETLDLATVYGQAYWENLMLANVENKSFNSRVAEIALRGQYPDDYKDSRETKVDVKAAVTIDFDKEISDLIKALKV